MAHFEGPPRSLIRPNLDDLRAESRRVQEAEFEWKHRRSRLSSLCCDELEHCRDQLVEACARYKVAKNAQTDFDMMRAAHELIRARSLFSADDQAEWLLAEQKAADEKDR